MNNNCSGLTVIFGSCNFFIAGGNFKSVIAEYGTEGIYIRENNLVFTLDNCDIIKLDYVRKNCFAVDNVEYGIQIVAVLVKIAFNADAINLACFILKRNVGRETVEVNRAV